MVKLQNHIWVVESKEKDGKWYPLAEGKLTRESAYQEKSYYWEHNFPDTKYRVQKYVRANSCKKIRNSKK